MDETIRPKAQSPVAQDYPFEVQQPQQPQVQPQQQPQVQPQPPTVGEQQDSECEQSEAEDSESEADEQHEVRRSGRQRTRNQQNFNSAFVNSAQVEGGINNNPPIPSAVKEALEGPNADDWRAAIAEELQHHAEQNSYRLELRLPGRHTVPSMFISQSRETSMATW